MYVGKMTCTKGNDKKSREFFIRKKQWHESTASSDLFELREGKDVSSNFVASSAKKIRPFLRCNQSVIQRESEDTELVVEMLVWQMRSGRNCA